MFRKTAMNNEVMSWILLVILSLIWGSSFILIKIGLTAYPAPAVGAMRVLFAGLFLLPFAIRNFSKYSALERKYLFVVGLSGSFIPAILFAFAQTNLTSSLTGILNSLTPIFVLVIGAVFFQQKLKILSSIGVILGFAGCVLLIAGFNLKDLQNINQHAFLVILATCMYGLNLNIIKNKLVNVKPTHITSISVSMVAPLALLFLFLTTDSSELVPSEEKLLPLLAIAALGIFGMGIALFLFNNLVKMSTAIFTSSVTYLIPIVAIMWGLWDNESLFLNHYVGLGVVLGGILLINRKR